MPAMSAILTMQFGCLHALFFQNERTIYPWNEGSIYIKMHTKSIQMQLANYSITELRN